MTTSSPNRLPKEHDLKIWQRHFVDIVSGKKKAEHRVNDRGFQVGDTLLLREVTGKKCEYTGKKAYFTITHIIPNGNMAILSIEPHDTRTTPVPNSINVAGYNFPITDIEKPYYAKNEPAPTTTCDDAAFQAFMLAYHEHGGTALGFRKCLAVYDAVKVTTIDSALTKAAEILANFKGEPDSTKLEEWQACYAHLFRQMTQLVEESRTPTPTASKSDDNLNTSGEHAQSLNAPNAELVGLLQKLCNAADDVGVSYFDGDNMNPLVEAMQNTTLEARAKLAQLGALKEGKS